MSRSPLWLMLILTFARHFQNSFFVARCLILPLRLMLIDAQAGHRPVHCARWSKNTFLSSGVSFFLGVFISRLLAIRSEMIITQKQHQSVGSTADFALVFLVLLLPTGTHWYQLVPTCTDKAVNRRARLLPAEYRHKLSQIDQVYHGTRRGYIGPVIKTWSTPHFSDFLTTLLVGG